MINGEQNTIIIETKRLYLREIRDSDVEGLRDILGDKEVMEFSIHGAEDTQGIKRFIKGTKERYRIHGMAQWAVILKQAGQFIGECGISVQHIDIVEEFEIGYRFAKKYWGSVCH